MLVTNFRLKYALYKAVLAGFQLFDTGRLHPVRERAIRALNRSVDYVESHMADAIGFDTQKEVLSYALSETKVPGHYLEFGVFTGGTIRYMAKELQKAGKRDVIINGFDSFEGLPEAWSGFNLGRAAFSVGGRLPRVPDKVRLHKGWFGVTIPAWRAQQSGPVAFTHIDCDLYSSTVDILEGLRERLQAGTVIVFDEYFNYPNWERHEFKAWQEFVARHGVSYEYLAFARQQVALRILSMRAAG
jgi:predicted O-methyltransferase YrrM